MGRVHSIESMGLVDGPGIRTVVFFQGCALRCKYCHNPDAWCFDGGTEMSSQELLAKILRFKPYFIRNQGGVTFSGGEPLMQPDFLLEMLSLCKKEHVHTCLDTAGVGLGDYDEILQQCDLVLYDIKHVTQEKYLEMTGQQIDQSLAFLEAMKRNNTKIWIRHVVIPGLTDSNAHMRALQKIIQYIPNVEKVELLPYHLLGENKYKQMGLPYPLKGFPAMSSELTEQYQKKFFDITAKEEKQ